MSLAGDKEHLGQLAGELPQGELGELRGTIKYAGEEARIALGEGHPRMDELNRAFGAFDQECGAAEVALQRLIDLLFELSR